MAKITQKARPDAGQQTSFWASFTMEDMRSLIVGVIGGLLVVMIVALAFIVKRNLGHIRGSAAFYLVLSLSLALLGILSWRAPKNWVRTAARLLLATVLGLIFVLGTLLFLGEAAGIK